MRTPFLERRRLLPPDPALWVWVAVALMALVPVAEHAVAARLTHAERATRAVQPAPSATAPQAPSAAGTATS